LRQVLHQQDGTGQPWLLVLDDFESNLEPRDGSYVLIPQAAKVLETLIWTIRETSTPHRLLLTCRYDIDFTPLQHVHKQPLAALRGQTCARSVSVLKPLTSNPRLTQLCESKR